MVKQKRRSIKRTRISLILKRNVWHLLDNTSTKVITLYAAGVKRLQNPLLDGSGLHKNTYGIDGMIKSGTTGESQRRDSLMSDGLGIKDSGIIMAMSIVIIAENGIGSKERDGLFMLRNSHLVQVFLEDQKSVDLSIFRRNLDSHPPFLKRNYQDVKLDRVKRLLCSCGPTTPNADSLVEDSSITRNKSVSLESHMLGRELLDASKVQLFLAKD